MAAIVLGAACSLLLAASPALAAPQVDGEFSVSGLGDSNQITTGPDGNIWVTLDDVNDVARITPAGDVQEFNPANLDKPVGITTLGSNLWVSQSGGVAKFSPGDPNAAEKFDIATITDARAITVGPDGHLWTVSGTNVVEVPPADPASFEAHAGLVAGARWIAAGGDGNIWVADQGGAQIVSLTTAGVAAPGSPYSAAGGGPQGIAAGPGTQMAFTDPGSSPHRLGRITPGAPPLFTPIPTSDPFGITLGPDGAYWIGQLSTNNLGRLTPSGDYTTLGGFTPAGDRGPRQLTVGPDNTLWVTLQSPSGSATEAVARITGFVEPPSGVPEIPLPNDFVFGKVKKNKKKGTATLTVIVPGPGNLDLAATKKVKGDEETAAAAGEVKLDVKPKGKAKQKLQPEGKAKVAVEVTFTPTGGSPNTEDKKLKLVKRR